MFTAALVKLRIKEGATHRSRCDFEIPEWLFDLDTRGHYLHRIKSVSVSIPGVVGPYTSVNCKLTLLSSQVRHKSTLPASASTSPYKRPEVGDDPRFTDYYGATEAIVTSTANGDSGLFETQLRDERFLPFEGSGVISTWRLELPGEYPQFDYSTISDVVLTIRYTARDGGDVLRNAATEAIRIDLQDGSKPLRFEVLLSSRHDFSTEWASKGLASFIIPIKSDLLPYWMAAAGLNVQGVLYADPPQDQAGKLKFLPTNALTVHNASVEMPTVLPGKTDRLILLEVGR